MSMKELGLLLGVLALWFVLARWVLPMLGINTCMSGACSADPRPAASDEFPEPREQGGEVR
jgi:hypothetical protein